MLSSRMDAMQTYETLASVATGQPNRSDLSGRPALAQPLIVVVLDPACDGSELSNQISGMAAGANRQVRLVGVSADRAGEAGMRQRLLGLAGSLRQRQVESRIEVGSGPTWIEHLSRSLPAGGQVIECLGIQPERRSEVVPQEASSPVVPAAAIGPEAQGGAHLAVLRNLSLWLGTLVLLAGFFWGQVTLDRLTRGFDHALLLCLTAALEVGLLMVWNNFLS
jgi:hypothetical protein